MAKKIQRRSKRPSAQRQASKSLGGHTRARNRLSVRKITATSAAGQRVS